MKPRSDFCLQCQQNSTSNIMKVANQPEADWSEAYKTALEHLHIVKTERKHYKTICDECKQMCLLTLPPMTSLLHHRPAHVRSSCNTRDVKVHYSFDYAQQVHHPFDPLQPSPIYFLTPRKCTVFGVAYEALPHQINFLTDEARDCGKGANAVISRSTISFCITVFGRGTCTCTQTTALATTKITA